MASQDGLVPMTVMRMKELILQRDPGTSIGSLPEIADLLGVGIVTVRQAARLLEHEGYLKVRRGNNGGFYSARPDADTLERALSGLLKSGEKYEREVVEIMTLLDCDLIAEAAHCSVEELRDHLRILSGKIDGCDTADQRSHFISDMHDVLFKMVDRPLMETLLRFAMKRHALRNSAPIYDGPEGVQQWKKERHAIIHAILRQDPDLARFEAQRRRDYVLRRLANSGADEAKD